MPIHFDNFHTHAKWALGAHNVLVQIERQKNKAPAAGKRISTRSRKRMLRLRSSQNFHEQMVQVGLLRSKILFPFYKLFCFFPSAFGDLPKKRTKSNGMHGDIQSRHLIKFEHELCGPSCRDWDHKSVGFSVQQERTSTRTTNTGLRFHTSSSFSHHPVLCFDQAPRVRIMAQYFSITQKCHLSDWLMHHEE